MTGNSKVAFIGLGILGLFLAYTIYAELQPVTPAENAEEDFVIESINVPGSFNEWNTAANEMQKIGENQYELQFEIAQPQLLQFKFTANKNWDFNLGETDQEKKGFPISGTAELDNGNNTQNIKGYIPYAGTYKIVFDAASYNYSLDSLSINLSQQ